MNTNIINSATANINNERELAVIRNAQALIGNIEREQGVVKTCQQRIESHRIGLKALAEANTTYQKVTGTPEPVNPTLTQQAVVKAINELVKSKQAEVESAANSLGNAIANEQAAIVATEQRIAALRKQLDEMKVEVVTPSTIIGS